MDCCPLTVAGESISQKKTSDFLDSVVANLPFAFHLKSVKDEYKIVAWNKAAELLYGVSREEAYALVQRNAMKTWEQGKDFLTELKADKEVAAKLSTSELEAMFDDAYHLKHVDTIFARVFGKP